MCFLFLYNFNESIFPPNIFNHFCSNWCVDNPSRLTSTGAPPRLSVTLNLLVLSYNPEMHCSSVQRSVLRCSLLVEIVIEWKNVFTEKIFNKSEKIVLFKKKRKRLFYLNQLRNIIWLSHYFFFLFKYLFL